MLSGSILLAIGYAFGVWMLARGRSSYWSLALAVALAGTIILPDPLPFSYPLIVGLVTYRYVMPQTEDHAPTVKGSASVGCVAMTGMCILMLFATRKWLIETPNALRERF